MKKKLFLILLVVILISGCQTQEERKIEKEKQRIEEITKEVEKNEEIPDEAKEWIIDNKAKNVLTVLCIKTSSRCNTIKNEIQVFEKDIKIYFIELDDLEENVKKIYKETYELDNYTGYLPYVYIVRNNKLIATKSDINSIEDIKSMLIENKIVSN